MPMIPVLGRTRHKGHHEFKTSLYYIRSYPKQTRKKKKERKKKERKKRKKEFLKCILTNETNTLCPTLMAPDLIQKVLED